MAKRKLKTHVFTTEWCKGCGICVAFCPQEVLALDESQKVVVRRSADCIACELCAWRCPDQVIEIKFE